MRLEVREFLHDDRTPKNQVLFVAESEEESKIMDLLGNPGDKVKAELALSDGYGEFYLRAEKEKAVVNPGKGDK